MSAVKRNVVKLEGVEWKGKMDFATGKLTISGTYRDDYNNWMVRVPAAQSANPDIPAALLQNFDFSRVEGDMIDVTLNYESTNPSSTYPGNPGKVKRYHMEPGMGEEPLTTSDLFDELTDDEREAARELLNSSKTKDDWTTAKNALTTTPGILFISKVRKGMEAYRMPGVVWVERFTTDDLDDVELDKVLKTTENPNGPCPSGGSSYNWLRLAPTVSPHSDGKTWDMENRWELSLSGKWDPDFYPSGG